MFSPISSLLILTITAAFSPVVADLKWGTFLGADWEKGEERLRSSVATSIKNSQIICSHDVSSLCFEGRSVNADSDAVSLWTEKHYKRKQYTHFDEIMFGFGNEGDKCLHNEYEEYESGTSKRLAPKCVEWIEKTESKFETVAKREKGNDKREGFVIFATLFATTVSLAVGFMFGIFMRDRDEILGYGHGRENKRVLVFFAVAISIPALVILWACPRLFMLMAGGFVLGRLAQVFYERKYGDNPYSMVSGGNAESGLVFAAIPVQMD
mmetsp:Transcript_8796/g.18658  ORF Transcript_8796/g.18658 Transcript_8796/m.18658 type:complete len:267 (-) Transcript_8796:141-941(-)